MTLLVREVCQQFFSLHHQSVNTYYIREPMSQISEIIR